MSFPRYPKYKDSGVEWLGEVPEHWAVSQLKRIVSMPITDGPHETPEFVDEGVPFVSAEAVSSGRIDFTKVRACISAEDNARYSQKYAPRRHDIFMVKSGATTGITAIVEDRTDFNIWSPLAVIRCNERNNPRFVLNFMRSRNFQEAVALNWSFGTQQNIGMGVIENLPCILPPIAEQAVISKFLDGETKKIDELVAEQQRLMELLKEKRQAVISHAVTKGLNPRAPMKPSGIEWLGDVPEHWAYSSLTRIASRVVVGIAEAATHAYADEGVPILRSTNIRPGRIIGDILRIEEEFAGGRDSKLIRAGDLITVRTGNAGVTAVIPPELDRCQCFTMLITTLNGGYSPEYYCYWMNSIPAQCYFGLEGWGTAQVNISVPILKALPVPMPPASEQAAIVAYLTDEIGRLDALAAEAQKAIDLLQERRTALISAAVTGQIDVRKLAAA